MSPNKIPYDGPKNFDQIVIQIHKDLGYPPDVIRKSIVWFFKVTIFDRLRTGKRFSLRGVGMFNQWQGTKNRLARGDKLIMHNVDSSSARHSRKTRSANDRHVKKKRAKKEEESKKGWDF